MNSNTSRPLALVTGASSGIGREFALQLAASGYDLIVLARRESELQRLATELAGRGARAEVVCADLGQPVGVAACIRAVGERPLQLLVNNAGFGLYGLYADTDGAREQQMIDLNVSALTALTKGLLPALRRARGGVINVASTAAFQPGPWMAVYYATKAYVLSLSEALAAEWAVEGLRVMALCPGPTRSAFQQGADMGRSGLLRLPLPGADSVVASGLRAYRRGARVHIPGWINRLMAFSVRLTPRRWVSALVYRLSAPVR